MLIQPIDYFLVAWFALCAVSVLYVGIDQYRNNPEPVVMKWGFILVTLYTGPLGLLIYVLADKVPYAIAVGELGLPGKNQPQR